MATVTHALNLTLACRRAAQRHNLDGNALASTVLAEYRRTDNQQIARRKLFDLLRDTPSAGGPRCA